MTPQELAADLGVEYVGTVTDDPFCAWPHCNDDPAISPDGGITWWCWEHASDEFLPQLVAGIVGACAYCRTATVWWIPRWPQHDDLALHAHCRRPWAMRLAEAAGGSVQPETDQPVRARGAYGRRRS